MDPLFERRNLTRIVRIPASQMQKNVRPALLAQLRSKYEGVCIPEGYCQPEKIMVVEQSLGRTDLVHSGVEYHVVFQADICMPHAGQMWRGTVKLRSKIGVHVETGPVQVLLPRDIHMGDETFESIKENQQIEFEVIGSRFQQGDTTIAVLGKLKTVIAPEPFQPKKEDTSEPMMAAPVTPSEAGEQKVVTVVATAAPTAVPRKRKLNTNANKD
jgi:DNA-directed RNA polymerase subunit E'/Rpb7